jgi:iron complex transport system substrate-binding protein
MKRKEQLFFGLVILLCLLLSGCGKLAVKGSYTVTDARGKAVAFSAEPKKILTDSLHLDETAMTLVPASRFAGAYYLDGEPAISFIASETKKLPKMRQYTPESVAACHPDVFFASTWSDPSLVEKLEEMGIPVFVCHGPVTVAEVEDNVRLMGQVLHQEAVGRKVIRTMENELDQIETVVGRQQGHKPVGILLSLMSRYGGAGSLYDELAARGGWVNGLSAGGLKNGMEFSKEAVLASHPDFILLSQPSAEDKEAYDALKNQFLQDPAYAELQGYVRFVSLPDRYVYDASPHLVYGIKAMANAAYDKMLFPSEPEELLKGY